MKTEKQTAIEVHDELVRELVVANLEIDKAHMREPLKKQDQLCADARKIEENISLLEKRYKL